jgi:hypothetical protein
MRQPGGCVLISADYTANENERVINETVTDYTISLPDTIDTTDACGNTDHAGAL